MSTHETAARDSLLFTCDLDAQNALRRSLRPDVAPEPVAKQQLKDSAAYWL
jgi:hypothetical protein